MLPFEDRFSRQRRLAEVGPDGQRRLGASQVRIAHHCEAELERSFLERAGVGHVGLDAETPPADFPWAREFAFEGPRGVASAAFFALRKIKAILAVST